MRVGFFCDSALSGAICLWKDGRAACVRLHIMFVCMWARVAEATGEAGDDKPALWENYAVKNAAAVPASLYRQISQQWPLGHLPCDVNS